MIRHPILTVAPFVRTICKSTVRQPFTSKPNATSQTQPEALSEQLYSPNLRELGLFSIVQSDDRKGVARTSEKPALSTSSMRAGPEEEMLDPR